MFDALQAPSLFYLLTAGYWLGLFVGFCSVLAMCVALLRGYFLGQVPSSEMASCEKGTRYVGRSLALLWVSGLGFLLYWFIYQPSNFHSSVLQAKMAVTGILTITSIGIHFKLMPIIRKYSAPFVLAYTSAAETSFIAICLAVSVVSWSFSCVLACDFGLAQQSVVQLLSRFAFALIVFVPFACAITFRVRLHIRETSLLTYQSRV